ncbi:3292_t:CDS:2, partial [Scutellospora calospora]
GYYPIPENFWINSEILRSQMNTSSLIRRTAIPTIYYWKDNDFGAFEVPSYLPRDSYVVSDCNMTRELQCQKPGTKWPVFVKESGGNRDKEYGESFGYLIAGKKNETDMEVSLVILPYNYLALFKLLGQLRPEQTLDWKGSFEAYRKTLPWYYLQPLYKAFVACNLDRTVDISLFTKPKTDGLDSLLNQIVQQSANPKLDEMRKEIVANRWSVTRTIPLPETNYDVTSLLDITSTIRREFRESLNAPIETGWFYKFAFTLVIIIIFNNRTFVDSANSVGTGDMGNFNKEMIKAVKKDNFRNPFEDNSDAKKKDDKRAFGSPFKNPIQKPPYKWSLSKMPPGFRERLPSGLKPISFQGLPELGINPFIILPGRQLTTTIGPTTTKNRSIKLPKHPFDVNNSKIQGHKPTSRLNFNSKPLTPPLTPTHGSFSSFSPDPSRMDLDENQALDMGSNLLNDGVQITDNNNSRSQMLVTDDSSLEMKSVPLNTSETNTSMTSKSLPSSSELDVLASLKNQKTNHLSNNLEILNSTKVNSKNSIVDNNMNNLQGAISIETEPSKLNKIDQGDKRIRTIKRILRPRPLKNYEIFDLHSSGFAIHLRQKIQAGSPVYNEPEIIDQLREFAESNNYSQDSKIRFIKSIKEFVKASRKTSLLQEVERIVNELENGSSDFTDRRPIKKVIDNMVKKDDDYNYNLLYG